MYLLQGIVSISLYISLIYVRPGMVYQQGYTPGRQQQDKTGHWSLATEGCNYNLIHANGNSSPRGIRNRVEAKVYI